MVKFSEFWKGLGHVERIILYIKSGFCSLFQFTVQKFLNQLWPEAQYHLTTESTIFVVKKGYLKLKRFVLGDFPITKRRKFYLNF